MTADLNDYHFINEITNTYIKYGKHGVFISPGQQEGTMIISCTDENKSEADVIRLLEVALSAIKNNETWVIKNMEQK